MANETTKITTEDLMNRIDEVRSNPAAMQSIIIDMVEEVSNGEHMVLDASNPFVFLLEATATVAANSVNSVTSETRKLYGKLADSNEDLYRHMSDNDYLNRFATPSTTTLAIYIAKDEITAKAVAVDGSNIRKVTIPPHTRFYAKGVEFGMQYPIDIRVLPHGAIQARWDLTFENTMYTLSTSALDYRLITLQDGTEKLVIEIPVIQYTMETSTSDITVSAGFKESFSYNNQFYYVRVYQSTGSGWSELTVTHSDQVFDIRKPTALALVRDGNVQITIPQIYLDTGYVSGTIRVDVYSTQGDLEMILNDATSDAFSAEYRYIGDPDNSKYVSPLAAITNVSMNSPTFASGGNDGLTFEELRERVIYSTKGEVTLESDIEYAFEDMGYKLMRRLDNITDRLYLAIKELPGPESESTISTIGVANLTLKVTPTELSEHPLTKTYGNTVTILPNTLFDFTSGYLEFSDNAVLAIGSTATSEEIVNELNNNRFLYTPFHYALTLDQDSFEGRVYYLNSPSITNKKFIENNPTVPYDAGIERTQITVTESGYRIYFALLSGSGFKTLSHDDIDVQVAFTPKDTAQRVYSNAKIYMVDGEVTLVDGERVYYVDLETDYRFNDSDELYINNFDMNVHDESAYPIELEHEFEVFISIADLTDSGIGKTDIDINMGTVFLPGTAIGISHETVTFKLGSRIGYLEGLKLTEAGEPTYQTHETDVPLLHTKTQYANDADGYLDVSLNNGDIEYTVTANIGDQVIIDGEPQFEYRAGDLVLVDGNPVTTAEAERTFSVEMVLFDAAYRYSTDDEIIKYRESLPDLIVGYAETELSEIDSLLPPRTDLQFLPKPNMGIVDITVADDEVLSVNADLGFTVDLYLTTIAYSDLALRAEIETSVKEAIADVVGLTTISTTNIAERIKAKTDESVVAVSVSPLTDKNLDVFTLLDSDGGFSVSSKTQLAANGTIKVIDDITINMFKHL